MTRDMKLYGIIESYQDYKCADASNWGVAKTIEGAKEKLIGAIEQQFNYIREDIIYDIEEELDREATLEEVELKWQEWINAHLTEGGYGDTYLYKWEYDDGDTCTKFYIDEISLK